MAKALFLIRHAKSSWAQDGLADHERALAERGLRDTGRMFTRLRTALDQRAAHFDSIVTSDAVRAISTAKRLAQSLELPSNILHIEPRLYLASSTEILSIIHDQSQSNTTIALVGHNPGFTDAANLLTTSLNIDNLPTCGIVGCSFSAQRWQDIEFGTGDANFVDYPKNSGDPISPPPTSP